MDLSCSILRQRIAGKPGLRHRLSVDAGQVESLRQQTTPGIKSGNSGFPDQLTSDQSTVVMAGTAQLQNNPQPCSLPPGNRQHPAATGVEQITFMHENPIDPETHLVRPPTQHEALVAVLTVLPVFRPGDGLLDAQPDTTPRPDQQSTLRPIGTMQRAPGFGKDGMAVKIAATMPGREQIKAAATSKRFNPRQSLGLERGPHRDLTTLTHKMMALSQTPVGLHARPQDLRLLGRLLLHRDFRLRFSGE